MEAPADTQDEPLPALDPDTLEAYFHLAHKVGPVPLRPLDLYRCLALEALGSPYVTGAPVVTWDQCARAVLVCAAPDHAAVNDIVVGQNPAFAAATLEALAAWVYNLAPDPDPAEPAEPADRARLALAQFSAYWADYYPTYKTTVPAGAKGRVQGSLHLRLAAYLQANTSRTRDQAWGTSPGEALQELLTISQQNGSKATKIDPAEAAAMRALGWDV